jgi:cysteine desulfurase/selenocysteine lyase
MGVGFFYGKRKWLEELPPYHGGGTMMESVFMDSFTEAGIPKRFEAGTPPVADVIGFGKAISYLQQFDWQSLTQYEESVVTYAERTLRTIPRVRLIGHPEKKTAVVSFLVDKIHPHDVATIVSDQNVALRAGYHCCQPLMHRLGCKGGVVRASFGIYNTFEDVDRLAEAIHSVLTVFKS